jgi:hypothetical protein
LAASAVRAEKNADLKPTLIPAATASVKESFDTTALPEAWRVNKGDWQVKDGAVVGKEKAEDMHAAVLTLTKPFSSTAVRFSFKRDGATGFNLSFNHAKGHLFRLAIADGGLTLSKDKDKKDPNSKIEVLARAEGKFPPGQWHTLLVEVQGDTVSVQADNGAKLTAKHADLNVEKTGYRFVTRNSSLLLDDLTIWSGK